MHGGYVWGGDLHAPSAGFHHLNCAQNVRVWLCTPTCMGGLPKMHAAARHRKNVLTGLVKNERECDD